MEWGTHSLAALGASYLLGALPFGVLLVRWFRGVDLRTVGSGNIGATNAIRAAGKPVGLAVFVLDLAKGFVPAAFFARLAGPAPEHLLTLRVACGAAAVLGHCFPIYLRFRGGKGVATACGALIAIAPIVFVVGGLAWLVTMGLTRFTGLASMVMGVSFPVVAWFRAGVVDPLVVGCALLAGLIVVRHRANIARMLAGTEPRAGSGGSAEQSSRSDSEQP